MNKITLNLINKRVKTIYRYSIFFGALQTVDKFGDWGVIKWDKNFIKNLRHKQVWQLRKLAKDNNIKGAYKMRKSQLVSSLINI
mgnify:CR=1 FL=1|tara:strand:+ start:94 stop:345 length:252 start_codon:yes stop_codon:yes gene_type:complete